jgi:hypothetical protein
MKNKQAQDSAEWTAIRETSPHTRAGDLKTAPNAAAIEILYVKLGEVGGHWAASHILGSAIDYLRTGKYLLSRPNFGRAIGPNYPATK